MTVRNIEYDTNETPEQVYSRLTWAVEKVDRLFSLVVKGETMDTNRAWVGMYDKKEMKFELIEPRGFININLLQIIVIGQIVPENGRTMIKAGLVLGWYPLVVSILLYLWTIGMIVAAMLPGDPGEAWNLILWVPWFPILWTVILMRKLNQIEKRVEDLFGIS